jgi:hypothetical protein
MSKFMVVTKVYDNWGSKVGKPVEVSDDTKPTFRATNVYDSYTDIFDTWDDAWAFYKANNDNDKK